MGLEKTVQFAAICDACGPDWWQGNAETAPMFLSKLTALIELVAQWEWRIQRRIDGRADMLCAACSAKHDCDAYGHQWYAAPTADTGADVLEPPVEMCRRCSIVRRDQDPLKVPPTASPESLTAELDRSDEALLARYDAEIWSDDAELTGILDALARLEASKEN